MPGLDWTCNPDKWLATVSVKLTVQAVPRHFLEATGILNGGEGSVFRWNHGKKRKPNVKMFHRSKTQVVLFFLALSNSPKAVLQKHHGPNDAPFKCVMVMQQKDIYFLWVFAPMLHSCWCILTV